jgi:N,N'-diacetyllegionaminate synthase
LVKSVNEIQLANQNPINKSQNEVFNELKSIFEKSLALNKNLAEGHIITFNDLESKKPRGYGIPATDFEKVLGKKLKVEKSQWDFLTEEDLA